MQGQDVDTGLDLGPAIDAARLIAGWAVAWGALYAALLGVVRLRLPGRVEPVNGWQLYANRVASLVHATYVCSLVLPVVLFVDGQGFFTLQNFGGVNAAAHDRFLAVCGGWMAFDLVFEILASPANDLAMYAHHLLVLVTCWFSMAKGRYGPELAATTLMSEATTPFLSLKFILKHHGLEGTPVAVANDAVFSLGFLFLRIGWGTFLLRATVMSEAMHWFVRLGAFAMTAINWLWARGIAAKMVRFILGQKVAERGSKALPKANNGPTTTSMPQSTTQAEREHALTGAGARRRRQAVRE